VNATDNVSFVVAPDLITYAERRGWYTPAKAGDYSDFDFAISYQDPKQNQAGNIVRHKNALRMLLGKEPEDGRAFSVKPVHQMGVADLKKILRSHYEGTEDDLSQGYTLNPHRAGKRTICAGTTIKSKIISSRERFLLL
jgi:dipeptidase